MTYPPTAAHSSAPRSTPGRTVDRVVTVLLLLVVLGCAAVLGLFSMFSVMATDSCGTGATDEPAICDSSYMGAILLGYWAGLAGIPTLTLVGSGVALARHRLAWPYAAAGVFGLALITATYVALLSR